MILSLPELPFLSPPPTLRLQGIASGRIMNLDLERAARAAVDENERVALELGIQKAERVTTIKPAGTTSLVLGTSSGIHAWHAPYYIRRLRVNKHEAIYGFLLERYPDLIEDDIFNERQAVLSFPQKAPAGATLRGEPALAVSDRRRGGNESRAPSHLALLAQPTCPLLLLYYLAPRTRPSLP